MAFINLTDNVSCSFSLSAPLERKLVWDFFFFFSEEAIYSFDYEGHFSKTWTPGRLLGFGSWLHLISDGTMSRLALCFGPHLNNIYLMGCSEDENKTVS